MKTIDLLVPFWNEEDCIDALYTGLDKLIREVNQKFPNEYDVRMLFINDGSRDKTAQMLDEIFHKDKRVTVLHNARNFEHQYAVTAGLDYTNADAVIILDADLQDPPEVCIEMIEKWREGYEVVYAQRKSRDDSWFKKFTATIFYNLLEKASNLKIPKETGDFRLVDKKVVEAIRKFREHNRMLRGLFTYVGFKQTPVFFERKRRFAGESHYSFKRMYKLALNGITEFSDKPLHLLFNLSYLVAILSFVPLIVQVFKIRDGLDYSLVIISIIGFCTALIVLSIAVVGLYVGRIFTEVQQRPLYVLDRVMQH